MDEVRRGYEPKDAAEFGPKSLDRLRRAAQEVFYLLDRGYDVKPATTFVGNHYLLSERQRLALARTISPSEMLRGRRERAISASTPPKSLWIDGFNLMITLEVALSGSLLLEGMDGTYRDLAGLRGTYRIVDKTVRAAQLLLEHLDRMGVRKATVLLDQQVSNSGRLRGLLLEKAQDRTVDLEVELYPDVDGQLTRRDRVVTSDAIILNACGSWLNLARHIVDSSIPDAWVVRLLPAAEE